ncbi:Aminoglycoside phosphotransferase [Venturia nashicola]|uniref:Aminoglycoside phosphotransferase n=1 Tax=Venturia nashicola TaxID=86259 RepID=A0A4Z1PQM1_9PEZI|nr:Aminoglycoside phosphotransferase [Venturia nashicola]
MPSWVFDCEERQVPGYYGLGCNGPLTADMDGNTDMSETSKEDAFAMLEQMKQDKEGQIEAFGVEEMHYNSRNEFRHRVGRLDYLEQLAQYSNQSAEPGPLVTEVKQPRMLKLLCKNSSYLPATAVEHLSMLRTSRISEPTPNEKKTFGSIVLIGHNNISNLVKKLIDEAKPDGVRITSHTASGSYNFVCFIKIFGDQFDGVEMALRIPACGREDLWIKLDRKALTSQARAIPYIKQNTKVPIPNVFSYDDTLENEIKAPFILMECVSGKSLGDCMVFWDVQWQDVEQVFAIDCQGVESATTPVFRAVFSTSFRERPKVLLITERICEAILEAVPESKMSQNQQAETLGLLHRDLDAQNLLIDTDGNLLAILDWDGFQTGPNSIGPHAFPKFLQDHPAGQYNELFKEGQMAKLRTVYSKFYDEEYTAAHGDAYGGIANKRSVMICELERGLRNVPDRMAEFVAHLFKNGLPDFDLGKTLSVLTTPYQDCTDIKEKITERFRRFLSCNLRASGRPVTIVGNFHHLENLQGHRLQSLAPNNEILIWNDNVSDLPSRVRSRDSSPTSSDKSDHANQIFTDVSSACGIFDATNITEGEGDGDSDTESDSEDDDRFANILGFRGKD